MVWRTAPWLAAAALAVAALAHLARLPAAVPLAVLGAAAIALAACAVAGRRGRITDATVLAIDTDAGLGGELHSANWFASRTARDAWADHHLAAAAQRLEGVDWSTLYPPARVPHARWVTAVCTAAALILAMTVPEPVGIRTAASAAAPMPLPAATTPRTPKIGEMLVVPPELQRRLEALLAAAERGDVDLTRELASGSELREMLNRLAQIKDAELLEALARAMADEGTPPKSAADEMEALAERAREAADAGGMSPEMRAALEQLADQLEIARPERSAAEASSSDAPGDADGSTPGGDGGSAAMDQLSIQFSQESDAGAGMGVMMPTPENLEGAGPPGAGFAGGASPSEAGQPAAQIEAALQQEFVDASAESAGGRVQSDIRRRTEQGDAQVSFTRGETRGFDPTRAAAAPPVPEARRSGVQTYFHRTP